MRMRIYTSAPLQLIRVLAPPRIAYDSMCLRAYRLHHTPTDILAGAPSKKRGMREILSSSLLPILNNLITTNFPRILRLSFPTTEHPCSDKRIESDKYKSKSNNIGNKVWIGYNNNTKKKRKKSEYRHNTKG